MEKDYPQYSSRLNCHLFMSGQYGAEDRTWGFDEVIDSNCGGVPC